MVSDLVSGSGSDNPADALEDAKAEEKIISTQFYKFPHIASPFGHALKDQFAIPSERFYLPDEPPIR